MLGMRRLAHAGALPEGSGQPALQLDGTIMRRMRPGEALEVRLRPRALPT
jgi:hypothetical protein